MSIANLPTMPPDHSHFPWLRDVFSPAIFTTLGAALGLGASLILDEWKAKRAKRAFIRGVGMEPDALSDQLDVSYHAVIDALEKVKKQDGCPYFAAALRTSLFTNQVGKISDVADPLVVDVIVFYSDLDTLRQCFEGVNKSSDNYNPAQVPSGEKDLARNRLMSALTVLRDQIYAFADRLRKLRERLPGPS
jgi:hypothetical protein